MKPEKWATYGCTKPNKIQLRIKAMFETFVNQINFI